jgi:hypothetical protein
MLKRIGVLVSLGIVAMAVAATFEGIRGRGVAVNRDGVRGHFAMEVSKRTDGKHTRVPGHMLWESAHASNVSSIRIEMREARDCDVEGHAGVFAGPAVATLRHGGETRMVHGHVQVHVRDARHSNLPTRVSDGISIRFRSPTASFLYAYEGHVAEGDIQVVVREE